MDSDGEGDMDHDEPQESSNKDEEDSSGREHGHDETESDDREKNRFRSEAAINSLTGFLFGNIDEKGDLDEDFLDEESKRHLSSLNQLGIGSLVREIAEGVDVSSAPGDTFEDCNVKSPTAVDFSDIVETAEEEESSEDKKDGDSADSDDNQEEDDRKLMPPPSWLPSSSISVLTSEGGSGPAGGSIVSVAKMSQDEQISPSSLSPGRKLNTPLADMMPPELANVDVTSIFPEFRHGQVLRFSRLFKPAHVPHIWRKKRKKKEEDEEKKSKEGDKQGEGKKKEEPEKKDGKLKEESEGGEEDGKKAAGEEADVEEEEEDEEVKLVLNLGRGPKPEELADDDEDLLKRPMDYSSSRGNQSNTAEAESETDVAPWRYGPAQYWYDHLGVDETGQGFQYDFKLKPDEVKEREAEESARLDKDLDYDRYLMVTQQRWEDKIIWDGEEAKHKVLTEHKKNAEFAGWVPSTNNRTFAQSRSQSGLLQRSKSMLSKPGLDSDPSRDGEWHSIFPIENEALVYKNWEDDIIWDAENMDSIPSPKVMTLDPNDENMILEIPDDIDPHQQTEQETGTKKEKKFSTLQESLRKSKILLGKAGMLKDSNDEKDEVPNAVNAKDVFNLSNDEYYSPKQMDNALRPNIGSSVIQHSTPAAELRQPFFPTYMGTNKLRTFHRPPLKKYSHGPLSTFGPHPVQSLNKVIKRKAKVREQERQAFGGGEIFFMRTPQDLTGMDGEIILAEYSEEFPPLMMQVGMASKIKNYYKRKPGKDTNPPSFKYGELAYAHTSPFIGALKPGNCQQALENNMFRSPIYEHKVAPTDFLVIRTRHGYFVREVETIYAVGQEGPLMEVPGPNSKRANNFVRDFLQVFIYRLFWKSKDEPRRIKMEDIKKAFLAHSESSIRKRLKLCADFKRTGMDSNWWVLKPDFRLPTEEEIRAMVSPEQCCGWYSLITAEQRLKDAGYGEKSLFSPEEENEEDTQTKIDDEIRVAPWNTTRAYISAMKGKCLLQLTGLADPTGCGEGFSYIKVPNKPTTKEEAKETPVKKTVTGTDADLRKLNLQDAKQLLRKFGVPEPEIKKLSRWEVIDVVRTMSTEQAKQGQDTTGWVKFARGNRYSAAEHMERYKEECQRIFDLQNRVLASTETLSTDEESTSGEDSDFEEMGKNIESMLSNKKTSTQLSREKEEAERRELQRMLKGEIADKDKKSKTSNSKEDDMMQHRGRKLKIVRTFHDDTGRQYQRSEMVSNPVVIDAYLRIRQTRDPNFIKQFAAMDDQQKEEMRKERRRIQEQLRRIKRNQEKPSTTPPPKKKPKKEKEQLLKASKMKCGACGQIGHMRTNKECPMYNKGGAGPGAMQVAMTEEQEEEEEKNMPVDQDLINVEGTKITMSKTLLEHAESIRRKSLVLKVPKQAVETKKKRRVSNIVHCDYLKKPKQSSNRRRTDPLVTLSSIFESILNELRALPDIQLFLFPVNPKDVPDYYKIIKRPMDMQTMRESLRQKKYRSREDFLTDLHQIVENSKLYNGPQHLLSKNAQGMLDLCFKRFAEKEQKLMRLEKAINPLLDDNDQVALSYIFEKIAQNMKALENSWPFHAPVSKKTVKDYYSVIKKPMDLSTLLKNVQSHKYQTRDQFVEDGELLYTNSLQYNGADSPLTNTARRLMEVMKEELNENEDHIAQLENDIRLVQEAALDAADTDSMTGTSLNRDDGSILDTESLDGYSTKDNPALMEDDTNPTMAPFGDAADFSKSGPLASDTEFVDIEGDEESMQLAQLQDESYTEGEGEEDALAKDLQLSDNEDEEEEEDEDEDAGMDSTGTLNESSELLQDGQPMEVGEVGGFDENARSYFDNAAGESGDQFGGEEGEGFEEEGEEGDSFDPSEFFKNSALATAQAEAEGRGDINSDLQISDDSEDEPGGDAEEEPYPVIPTENQASEGFDIDEYL
ncbi:LOW QUALITY PROTEIN: transcription initiation factor TFIID subunit 1 [Aplysia californica]|uniref:Transcription initiation factor TFIID subunit 1 n=1 Tax=Aplysia californica TaxID=6500 RepID=A0ABM1AE86_APLCA|nr:LOW QUALITY PROTEIN: transcription initiation factor TFIID subunit 1 [Aplysia californica]